MEQSSHLLLLKNISKEFPGVKALSNVNFSLDRGEVKALVGENGAGKSTLIKIISGVYQPTRGEIFIDGKEVKIKHPIDARNLGISPVHQEVNLQPYLSVAENIFLNRQPLTRFGFVDYRKMIRNAIFWLNQMEVSINPHKPLGMIPIAERQMVAIAQAISQNAKIIIFDEPTSSLTEKESERLFQVIQRLCQKELGVIYISHRMEEVFRLCNSVTVLRDGEVTGNRLMSEVNAEEVIRLMVGRELKDLFRRTNYYSGEPILSIRNLTVKGILNNINLTLHRGEILGLSGLVGSGRTELARAIFGDLPYQSGEIVIDQQTISPSHPRDSIVQGVALVPEDRKEIGLVLRQNVNENISITVVNKMQKLGFIDRKKEKRLSTHYVEKLSIKTPGIYQKVQYLSGGNQQRVVISKWLATSPKILIIDEPTRGIDVNAKSEIHRLLDSLAAEGIAILMISSELPEILALSDRIAVMYQGSITAVLDRKDANEEIIASYATGQNSVKQTDTLQK